MKKILFTVAEDTDRVSENYFAVKYSVDEEDCLDFSRGLQELNYQVFFTNWLDYDDGKFRRVFDDNNKCFVEPVGVDDLDFLFLYKQEGFLNSKPLTEKFLKMLDELEEHSLKIINDPETIRENISKEYLIRLNNLGVRTVPTYLTLPEEPNQYVLKPRIGERGNGQSKIESLDGFFLSDDYLLQRFEPSIRNGERSLVFLGHEFSHAVIKRPNPNDPNEFRCNESLGGTVQDYQPTCEELNFAQDVLSTWEFHISPVHFSRIDLLSHEERPILLEAELLNPSIYANYTGRGREFGKKFARYVDELTGGN